MARPKSEFGSTAIWWMIDQHAGGGDDCYTFPFAQEKIRFLDKSRTPQWIACVFQNGAPVDSHYPVRECGTYACVNGKHFHWGTMKEAMDGRVFKSRAAEANPNAKLTELEVSQLKAINWGGGYHKTQVCEAHGISAATLASALHGITWHHVKPYVSQTNSAKDEF